MSKTTTTVAPAIITAYADDRRVIVKSSGDAYLWDEVNKNKVLRIEGISSASRAVKVLTAIDGAASLTESKGVYSVTAPNVGLQSMLSNDKMKFLSPTNIERSTQVHFDDTVEGGLITLVLHRK